MKLEGIIFDLDDTLVDTRPLMEFREERNWPKAIRNLLLTNVYPGIRELLDIVKSLDIKSGIVTSSPRKYAEAVVSYHRLEIPVLVAYQDTGRHKPNPDPILKGIEKLGVSKEKVLAIGDAEIDAIAAKLAGVTTAIVRWSKNEVSQQEEHVYSLCSPSELIDLLKRDYSYDY